MQKISNVPPELENDPAVLEYLSSFGSERSRTTMRSCIRIFLSAALKADKGFTWDSLTDAKVTAAMSPMQRTASPSTVNTILCGVRGVAERLWIDGRIDPRIWKFISMIKKARGSRMARGRMLKPEELKRLFAYCDRPQATFRDLRDAAIFAAMAYCGLRRSEVAGLRCENVVLDGPDPCLRLIGKGNKERIVPLPPEACRRMRAWRELRGTQGGFFFLAMTQGEAVLPRGLSQQTIYQICKTTAAKASIEDWSPHDLRRTCASALIAHGIDITTVRDWLGHSSITSTQLYDKRSQDRLRDVARGFTFGPDGPQPGTDDSGEQQL